MMYIESIKIYVNEEHLKSKLPPVKELNFYTQGHDEDQLLEKAAKNATENMNKLGFSKGIAIFKINRVSEITVYQEDNDILKIQR